MEHESTIVAISSAAGAAPRIVLRISGTRTEEFVRGFFAPHEPERGPGNENGGPTAAAGHVAWDPGDGAARRVPADLFFWPDRRSYTGEPCAELHVPGSPAMAESLVAAMCAAGARPAMPGEFTMRAFRHGRLDLVRAEAVLATIDAGDDRSLRTALAQLSGSLSGGLERLREAAADLVARLEAEFDFADEPMTFVEEDELRRTLGELRGEVVRLAAIAGSTADADRPVRIVLAGRPNAGKSRLFNRLTGSRAIVSPRAGTTRDYTTAPIRTFYRPPSSPKVSGRVGETESCEEKSDQRERVLHNVAQATIRSGTLPSVGLEKKVWCSHRGPNDFPDSDGSRHDKKRVWRGVLLVDVAGMADGEEWEDGGGGGENAPNADGSPERRADAAARRQLELADLVVLCLDATTPDRHDADRRRFRAMRGRTTADATADGDDFLCILTKCDRATATGEMNAADETAGIRRVSAVTGAGLGGLRRELRRRVHRIRAARGAGSGDIVPATALRCRDALRRAIEAIDAAIELRDAGLGDELAAVELRRFLNAIGELTGAVPTDELLGRIFSRFCVGK